MRYRIMPYKQGSKSAKALAEGLGGKVLKLVGSTFVAKEDDVVIGWGKTPPAINNWSCNKINVGDLSHATNKLAFFKALSVAGHASIIPRFWESQSDIPPDAYPIVCRTLLSSHSGQGIVIANTPSELVPAPLYVQYVKKEEEFRIHVGQITHGTTTVFSVQQKRRRLTHANPDWRVRNLANGFVYVREGVSPPGKVLEAARIAFSCVGSLDFGAIDVIWNSNQGRAFVLEINTAPGLEGQSVDDYVSFVKEWYGAVP